MILHSPVTLNRKLFLQLLWNQKISWDTQLSEQDKIRAIREDLRHLISCNFPRHIGLVRMGEVKFQLLVFCNASRYA